MKKGNIIAIAVILIVIIAFALYAKGAKAPANREPVTSASLETINPDSQATTTQNGAKATYTLADVAKHNSVQSCWTAVRGSVYDVTSWISRHPGGSEAILSLCGTDGTSAFVDQHEGQSRPERELARFIIGSLAK